MKNTSLLLVFLSLLFGLGGWIDINSIWTEMPILLNHLPEGWKLPSIGSLMIQISNIAPLIYLCIYFFKRSANTERWAIYFVLVAGCISCIILSIFWNQTVEMTIFGKTQKISVAFIIIILILSILNTTSSVTFLPYLGKYPRQYITAFYVGSGFGGLLPGLLGLIQGIGEEPYCVNKTTIFNLTNYIKKVVYYPPPRFSVSEFFIFPTIALLICLISFSIIDNHKYFKRYQTEHQTGECKYLSSSFPYQNYDESDKLEEKQEKNMSSIKWIVYILLIVYINFIINGTFPSIQNYSLMPYSSNLYHLTLTISQILNPLACLLTLRNWKINNFMLFFLTLMGSIGVAYELFLASQSPTAILKDNDIGQILAAFFWFVTIITFNFEKTVITIELQNQGHFWLQMCGAATQIGGFLGAVLFFVLISVLNFFKSKDILC